MTVPKISLAHVWLVQDTLSMPLLHGSGRRWSGEDQADLPAFWEGIWHFIKWASFPAWGGIFLDDIIVASGEPNPKCYNISQWFKAAVGAFSGSYRNNFFIAATSRIFVLPDIYLCSKLRKRSSTGMTMENRRWGGIFSPAATSHPFETMLLLPKQK